jgi:hypothetical protein
MELALGHRPREDLGLLVDRGEQLRDGGDVLRAAEEEKAGIVEREVQRREHPLLQLWTEVDEDVAAAHEIELGERRIARQIVLHERAAFADRLADPVADALDAGEVACEPLRTDAACGGLGVNADPGVVDRLVRDIGPEQLDPDVGQVLAGQELEQRDDEGIGLFPGRTSRAPDANRSASALLLQDLGEHVLAEPVVDLRVPEERRHVDEDLLEQRRRLRAIVAQPLHVVVQRGQPVQGHPARQAAPDAGELVVAEVDAGRLAQEHEHLRELAVLRRTREPDLIRLHGQQRVMTDALELAGEHGDAQRKVGDARRDGGLRHARELRGLRILRERDAALGLDRAQALGAVGPGTRQHDADRPVRPLGGQGVEEEVDGQVRSARFRGSGHQRERAPEDADVGVGGNHVYVVGLDEHAVLDLVNRETGRAGERIAQVAGVRRIQVLDQNERHAAVARDMAKQLDEGFHAPRGGADTHDRKRDRRTRWGLGRRSLAVVSSCVSCHLQPPRSPPNCAGAPLRGASRIPHQLDG